MKYSTLLQLLLDHNTISYISCPSCPSVQYCSPLCQAADRIHPLECKHFSALEILPELSHITARLLLLVAEEDIEPEELPFGQGTREFWDLLSHAAQIPEDDYWSVKIFQQVRFLQAVSLTPSSRVCCQGVWCATGNISQRSMATFSSIVLR